MAFDITGQLNLRLASGAIRNIANEINSGLRSTNVSGVNVPVRADMATLKQIKDAFTSTGSVVERFSQQSGLAFKRFAAFSAAAVPFIAVASGIRSAVAQAISFDKEMVRLRQVTIDAGSEVGQIANEVTRLSTSFGVSSADLMKTAVTLKQANLSINETRDALEALAKSALAPNFDSIAQTTEGAIAVMNQFKIQGKELEQALGSMNAVAGEFAVEAGDLIEVVRRTGGAFKATGGDLNQLLALFTSVRQTTRESAESIATGLRTIFTRIQRNDTVNALKEFGVNLRFTREEAAKAGNINLTNQFVGGYEAIRRLSQALTQLPETDPRFSAIVEDLGGYRQISKVIPLIQEFAVSEKALMVAEAGRVSMTINASQASESYSNRLMKLQESYLALGRSLLDSSSFKAAFTSFEGLANSLLMVLNAARPLLPVLTAIATIKVGKSIGEYVRGFGQSALSAAGTNVARRANGGPIYMAKGGIVPGSGVGDTVPAMLEPGELVIPRKQAQKVGFREKVIGRFMAAYNTEKGRAFADFYDQFRGKMDRLGAPGDPRRSFFERAYANQSQGASDKLVIEVMGRVYNQYRDMVREGKKATAADFKPMLDSLGLNDKSAARSKWFQQTLDGLAPTSRKKGDYYKGLTDPNFYPVDRNVIYTAYDVGAKEAKRRGLLQVNDKKYQFFHSALAEAAERMGTTGQRLQAAIFAARSKKNPNLAKTMAPLDKLVPYANGGLVPGVGNTDSVPALLPVGAFVLRKSSTNNLRKMAGGGKVPAMVMPGEYIFSPEEAKEIGLERLQKLNRTGKLPGFANGGIIDPKMVALADQIMKSGKDPNKDPRFQNYLQTLESAAISRGRLGNLASYLPKVQGRGLLQYADDPNPAKPSSGFVWNNRKADTAYLTKHHTKTNNVVDTPLHEIAHLIDLQAGRIKSGSSNTTTSYLSEDPTTKTNAIAKKLEALVHKAYTKTNMTQDDIDHRQYMTKPREMLARAFEVNSLKDKSKHYFYNDLKNNLSAKESKEAFSYLKSMERQFRIDANQTFSASNPPPPTTPAPNPTPVPTTAAPNPTTSAPTTVPPTTKAPTTQPPQKPRRAYDKLGRQNTFTSVIKTAMGTGNQVGPYANELPEMSGQSSIRFLNDLGKIKGGREELRSQIMSNLAQNNPNMTVAEQRRIAGRETNRILRTAKEASVFERRFNQAQNIQTQASSRASDIDQLSKLGSYINNLQKRSSFDPEAAAEMRRVTTRRNEIAQRVSQNENISLADLNRVNKSGRLQMSKTTRATLQDYQQEYGRDASGAAREAEAARKQLEERRKKLEGITVGMSQDPEGNLGFKFKGPDTAYGAQTRPPAKGNNDQTLGKILNSRVQDIFNIIDPTGKGKNVSKLQKEAILNDQKARLEREYVDSVRLQIQQHHKIKDAETARLIALQMYEQSLRTGAAVVVDKKGVVRDKAMADQGATGKGQSTENVREAFKNGLKNAFSSQSGFLGLQTLSGYLGAGANMLAGNAESAAKAGSENSFVATRSVGGAFTGAAMGAAMGSMFGPLGAGIGAAAGAAMGAAEGFKSAAREINEAKLSIALRETSTALSNFAKGTYNLTPQNVEKLQEQQTTADVQLSKKAAKDASFLGYGLVFSQDRYTAELNKSMRETQAGQAAPMMDALTTIIQDRAKLDIGNNAIKDRKSRENSFTDALFNQRGGLGGNLLGRVAAATGQDTELLRKKMLEMFIRIQDSELSARRKMTAETDVNKSAAAFGGLSSAVEIATQRMTRMNASMKNMTDFMDGSVTAYSGTGLSEALQRPFGSDRGDFMNAVRAITKTGGAAGTEVEKNADAISEAGRLLPNIINAVRSQPVANLSTGTDLSVQIGDMLRSQLVGQGVDKTSASMVTNMVQSQLGAEDFSKMLRESGQDMGKLIQKVLGPMSEPLKQSFAEIAKNLDERAKQFSDGLAELANRTRQTGELMDKANAAQASATRNAIQTAVKRRLISEGSADNANLVMGLQLNQARQQRLTGFAGGLAQNPDAIATALGSVFDSIKKAEGQIDAATKSGNINEQNEATVQLTSLKTRAADLSQALRNLTDVSERTAAAQDKLGKIQADREGRQQLGIRYATANVEGRAEIARTFSLIQQAGRMGTAAPFSVRDQNQIFSMLSSLSPQMRLQGLGGTTVKELTSQLMKTTFGGAFELDPQSAAIERALDNFVQQNYETAARAAQIQVEIQQKLQADFFARLESSQTTFINELSRMMAENNRMLALSMKMQAQTRLGDLEKKVGQASMLGRIGVTNDEQFKAVSDALNAKDSPIEKIFAAATAQAQMTKKADNAISNSDNFAKNIIKEVGKTSSRNVASSDAAATITNQFAQLGFSNETDRNNLLLMFSKELNALSVGGKLSQNQDQISQAMQNAVRNLMVERNKENENNIAQGQETLEKGGVIPQDIINKIVETARKDSSDFTITTMKEAVSAVSQTNKSFSELTKALDEARIQVQGFVNDLNVRPAVRLPGAADGGPIRFFNKGGWGSGGSSTPYASDTINARINPNEFVVSAGPANKNKALLEHINAGGRIGFAKGGSVNDYENFAKGIISSGSSGVINGEQTNNAVEEAKKLAFITGSIQFLNQLKEIKPEDREKFIESQQGAIDALKKKNVNIGQDQLGVESVLNQIKEMKNKRQGLIIAKEDAGKIFNQKSLEDYHFGRRNAAISLALMNPGFEIEKEIAIIESLMNKYISQGVKENSAKVAPQDKKYKQALGISLSDTLKKEKGLENHAYLGDLAGMEDNIRRTKTMNSIFESFGPHKSFGSEITGGYNAGRAGLRTQATDALIKEDMDINGPALETINQTLSFGAANAIRHFEASKDRVNQYILKKYYANNPSRFVNDWYNSTLKNLEVSPAANFANDFDKWFIESKIGKDLAGFNYERAIEDLIESAKAKLEEAKISAQKIKGIQGIASAIQGERLSAFRTPENQIKELAKIQPEDFTLKTQGEIMKAQMLNMEVEAFNKLNPALQSSLIEQTKNRIVNKKMSRGEEAQLDAMGLKKALENIKEVTGDELSGYNQSKSKMTLIQRAALEVLMQKLGTDVEQKAANDPDSLSQVEKIAYLGKLDSDGRTNAFARVNNRKNIVAMTRLGQFLTANPSLIESRLAAAEEKGPAFYAEEAALIEILTSAFGVSTPTPKASEKFKNKSLRTKEQVQKIQDKPANDAPAAPNVNAPVGLGAFINNVAGDFLGAIGKGKKILSDNAKPGIAGPQEIAPVIKKEQEIDSGKFLNNFVKDAVEQNQKPNVSPVNPAVQPSISANNLSTQTKLPTYFAGQKKPFAGSNLGLSAGTFNSGPAGAAINAAALEEQNKRTRSALNSIDQSPTDTIKSGKKLTYPWLPNYFGPEITPKTEEFISSNSFDEESVKKEYDKNLADGKLKDEKEIDLKTKHYRNWMLYFVEENKIRKDRFEKNDVTTTTGKPTYSWKPNYFGPKVRTDVLDRFTKNTPPANYIEESYNQHIQLEHFKDEEGIDLKTKNIRSWIHYFISENESIDDRFKKANGGLIKFASGGLVPGIGNTDSVRADLPVGSYVIRKSSVQKFGAENLAALPRLAKGGVVPAMVMPGEHIFTPQEASKIGIAKLDAINKYGDGSLGGVKPNANANKAVWNGQEFDVVNEGGRAILIPKNGQKWGGGSSPQMGFQPQSIVSGNNPMAQAQMGAINQNQALAQFQMLQGMNNTMAGGDITALKAKFFSLRNAMRDPRQRTKENIAQLRDMYATLTNPMIVQMDAQRQMMGAQEAFASFQQDPKAFIAKSKELRALAANAKASMEERVAAKEQLNQMNYAARLIDPRVLRAAAMPQRQMIAKQQAASNKDPLQGGLAMLNPGIEKARPLAEPKPQKEESIEDRMARERIMDDIAEIRDPGGVKRQAEKMRKFNEEKAQKRKEFEAKIFDRGSVLSLAEREKKYEEEQKIENAAMLERHRIAAKVRLAKRESEEKQEKVLFKEWNDKKAKAEKEMTAAGKPYWEVQAELNKIDAENSIQYQLAKEAAKAKNQQREISIADAGLKAKAFQENPLHNGKAGIVPGVGSGDTVPALLEPGELVVPKRQVAKYANGGIVGGIQGFANGGMAQGGPELLDVAAKFNQAATQISQGLSGFSTSVSTFNGAVANFGTFVDKFDEAVGKIPGQIELSGANDISVNLMGQDSIVKAVTEAIGPMIAQAIRDNQPVEQRAQ